MNVKKLPPLILSVTLLLTAPLVISPGLFVMFVFFYPFIALYLTLRLTSAKNIYKLERNLASVKVISQMLIGIIIVLEFLASGTSNVPEFGSVINDYQTIDVNGPIQYAYYTIAAGTYMALLLSVYVDYFNFKYYGATHRHRKKFAAGFFMFILAYVCFLTLLNGFLFV